MIDESLLIILQKNVLTYLQPQGQKYTTREVTMLFSNDATHYLKFKNDVVLCGI